MVNPRISDLSPQFLPFSLFGIAALTLLLTACGGSQAVSEKENVPEWYTNLPEDPNYVFAAQSATSQKMQVAVDKAMTGARGEMATNLETEVNEMNKSFTEEIGDEMRQQFVETQKTVTSRVLRGTSAAEKEVVQKGNGTYRAFVLMEMPIGKAAKELMSKVKQNDEMYTRFRASQAFKEMEEAIEEFEKEQQRARAQQQAQGSGGSNNSEEGGSQ
ncbi:LPP20 family lipoprotein [Salinibacter ruber]|uniref:LPP20 family lipoprotein n=1 Tax=Salinibacter ruber TaxID=146919 RepID=UPI002073962B|nr:LPP20 family lipoprotein [Salinibacter ruber]